MITLRHASTTAALLRGADHLLVLGSEAALKGKTRHPGLQGLSPEVQRLVAELLKDLSPGLGGAAAGTLCSEAPRRVAVGVLPNEVSRHNAPARAEASEGESRRASEKQISARARSPTCRAFQPRRDQRLALPASTVSARSK